MCTLKYRLSVQFKTKNYSTPMPTIFCKVLLIFFKKQVLFHIEYFSSTLKTQTN